MLREQVDTAHQQAYADAGGEYTDEAAATYVAAIVPVMAGAQAVAAQLTAAYLAYMTADMTGQALSAVVPPVIDLTRVTGAAVRNGVVPEVVYRRPFEQVWRDLAQPAPSISSAPSSAPDRSTASQRPSENRAAAPTKAPSREEQRREAVASGERRARTLGLTDLQLATTHTAREVLQNDSRVFGYRRVLTGAENCGLCIVASTALYHTSNLMPIHNRCDCVVAVVMGSQDPGRLVNNHLVGEDAIPTGVNKHGVPMFSADQTIDIGNLLEDAHRAVEQRFGRSFRDAKGIDYRKVITVREHGELGPVLTVSRHKFTKRQIEQNDLSAR